MTVDDEEHIAYSGYLLAMLGHAELGVAPSQGEIEAQVFHGAGLGLSCGSCATPFSSVCTVTGTVAAFRLLEDDTDP
ncbi:MAG TPA: hypothetical protein VEN78_08340, partial [Bradyrhizobium sp.]|nr:hypothetical protein [Bradyrhizobium sp.]